MREICYLYLTRFLPNLLDRKDRMSMAVGLEVRVPFCDHRLVEYVFGTPWAHKTFDGREKSLLRAATADLLPESVVQRVKSPYPSTQDERYEEMLRAEVDALVDRPDAAVAPLLDSDAVRERLAEPIGHRTAWASGCSWSRSSTLRRVADRLRGSAAASDAGRESRRVRSALGADMGLTRTDGPLSPHAPKTVNYAHRRARRTSCYMHPFPRRVRAEVAGRTVLDTVDGHARARDRAAAAVLRPRGRPRRVGASSRATTRRTARSRATRATARCGSATGSRRTRCGRIPEPTASAQWLAGYASLYWDAADAWFDEDEQVYAHLTDPFTRVDVRPTSAATSGCSPATPSSRSRPRRWCLDETGLPTRWYLSPDDVRLPLEPPPTRMRCPYKGESSYWSVRAAGRSALTDAGRGATRTRCPSRRASPGCVSFLHDELSTEVDGAAS